MHQSFFLFVRTLLPATYRQADLLYSSLSDRPLVFLALCRATICVGEGAFGLGACTCLQRGRGLRTPSRSPSLLYVHGASQHPGHRERPRRHGHHDTRLWQACFAVRLVRTLARCKRASEHGKTAGEQRRAFQAPRISCSLHPASVHCEHHDGSRPRWQV